MMRIHRHFRNAQQCGSDASCRGSPSPGTHVSRTRSDTMSTTCTHLDQIQDVTPSTRDGCEECLQLGTPESISGSV